MSKYFETPFGRRAALIILGAAFIASATALVSYNSLLPSENVELAAGEVAPADIIAPRSITYDSDVLTRLARQAASDAIRDVYDPPNPSVARQQIQLARRVLDYIDNVRHDTYSTPTQQAADLSAISAVHLKEDISTKLLGVTDDAWKNVDEQVMSVLERTMQGEIREDNLANVYANLPNLVGANVDEAHANVITALARELIKPNTFYNDERTKDARTKAASAVSIERRSFAQGQIVVRGGTIVSDADMEALTQLKLLQPLDRRLQALTGALLAVLLLGAIAVVYLRRLHTALFHDVPRMVLIGGLFLVFLAGARVFGTTNEFQSRVYPAAAFALIVVALSDPQSAMIMTGGLAALIGLIAGSSLEFTVMVAVGGAAGVLSLTRLERLNVYFRAGLVIAVANVAVGLLFALLQGTTDPLRLVTILGAGVLNGIIAAGVAIVGLNLISSILNMPTSVRLIELSQPNQPLLQRLLREAPGTYQHSLQVANLAELAAERVGANAALLRVAALYHDIGKIVYPHFFVENQVEGANPHDALNDPERSAKIIIGHVTDGEKLARKYRLPAVFVDAILQHHGTMQVLYFYNLALKTVDCDESKVNKAAFSYPGPRPQTREAAILMLADSSESIVRAKRPQNKQQIVDIVREIIDFRMADGQLDDSYLTVNDLRIIQDVFVATLQGVFHPRIAYPNPTPEAQEAPILAAPETTRQVGNSRVY